MKRIEAIVRSEKAGAVKDALANAGFPALTMYDVHGRGEQKGLVKLSLGKQYRIDMLPKTKLEIVAEDHDVAAIVDIIVREARTGAIGDGRIFVLTVDHAIRIRTGEGAENLAIRPKEEAALP